MHNEIIQELPESYSITAQPSYFHYVIPAKRTKDTLVNHIRWKSDEMAMNPRGHK